MSLVNEALKKARAQAALQQAARSPFINTVPPVASAPARRSHWPFIAGVVGGCFCVGIVSATVIQLTANSRQVAVPTVSGETTSAIPKGPAVTPRVSLPVPPTTGDQSAHVAEAVAAQPATTEPPAVTTESAIPTEPVPVAPSSPSLIEGKVYFNRSRFPMARP